MDNDQPLVLGRKSDRPRLEWPLCLVAAEAAASQREASSAMCVPVGNSSGPVVSQFSQPRGGE